MTLVVYSCGRRVGTLDMAANEPFYGFTYDSAYLSSADAMPLSLSLPLQQARFDGAHSNIDRINVEDFTLLAHDLGASANKLRREAKNVCADMLGCCELAASELGLKTTHDVADIIDRICGRRQRKSAPHQRVVGGQQAHDTIAGLDGMSIWEPACSPQTLTPSRSQGLTRLRSIRR